MKIRFVKANQFKVIGFDYFVGISSKLQPSLWVLTLYTVFFSLIVLYLVHFSIIYKHDAGLRAYAAEISNELNQLDFQIKKGLELANESTFEPCSKADVAHNQGILSNYLYLRDIGRIVDGQLVCSLLQGSLDKPIKIDKSAGEVVETRTYLNNQRQHFVEKGDYPMVLSGDYMVFLSTAFLLNIGNYHHTVNGSGGYVYLKDTDFIFKKFGKISFEQIEQAQHQPSGVARLLKMLISTDTFLVTEKCDSQSDICVRTMVKGKGLFSLSLIDSFLFCALAVLISLPAALIVYNAKAGFNAFLNKLEKAIVAGAIYPVYQTKVGLDTKQVVGVESLARWNDPDLGFVPPDIFIHVAEQNDLIESLTKKFVKQVFADMNEILVSDPTFTVSINVSTDVITQTGFIDFVESEITNYAFRRSQIIFEVTERVISNSEAMGASSKTIKQHGFLVSLDDFGTGYSNLSWLNTFEPDEVKIDKQFTQAIDTETVNSITLRGIFKMLEHLDVKVVFEGIETQEQLEFIKANVPTGIGQGWHFSKPVKIGELELN